MCEVEQDLDGLLHHVKGFASLHVHNETDTASVMLEEWIVESLFRWWVYPASLPSVLGAQASSPACSSLSRWMGHSRRGRLRSQH
jgi:hypothetical protein